MMAGIYNMQWCNWLFQICLALILFYNYKWEQWIICYTDTFFEQTDTSFEPFCDNTTLTASTWTYRLNNFSCIATCFLWEEVACTHKYTCINMYARCSKFVDVYVVIVCVIVRIVGS